MKKFLIVPSNQIASPLQRQLSQLDEEMNSILQRKDLSEFETARLYSEVLDRYLNVKRKLQQPTPIPIVEQQDTSGSNEQSVDSALFPKRYREKANNLLNQLNRTDLRWSDRGEILENGSSIKGSNIVDLVNDIIQPLRSNPPIGSQYFLQKLAEFNVPKSLIGNKRRLDATHEISSPLTTPRARREDFSTKRLSKPKFSPRDGRILAWEQ